MNQIEPAALIITAQLKDLASAPGTTRLVADVARQRLGAINDARNFLDNRSHRIAFVGHIGAGKSSMIGVLAQLLVGDAPTDRATLKQNSILAVGAGGTTVCEVRIRSRQGQEREGIAILSEPFTAEEMRREIEFFAQDEWARRHADARKAADDDRDPTPREIQRVIRNMTGFPERQETFQEGGQKKRRTIDPLDDVFPQHDSPRSLAAFLVEKAALLARRDTAWWWAATPDGFQEMKRRFDEINHGKTASAMLPKRLTLVVPAPLPDASSDLDIEVVDTRGFDGQLETREDIQAVLRDPRALVVMCTHFMDAPSENLRSLLKAIQSDPELRPSLERMVIVLMDHGNADHVNGADGDREAGQAIKLRECARALDGMGLGGIAGGERLHAFDALKDDRSAMIGLLDERLASLRGTVRAHLEAQVHDATSFLGNLDKERVDLAREKVDRELALTFEANRPTGAPLRDPLAGLYDGIRSCRWASQVLACCRRDGSYGPMDAYAAVRWGASQRITDWLSHVNSAMESRFRSLERDPELTEVADHIRLRRKQYADGYVDVIRRYADGVRDEVYEELSASGVWRLCQGEWGQGSGFKERVIGHLDRWSRQQAGLVAHAAAQPTALLPLLGDKSE